MPSTLPCNSNPQRSGATGHPRPAPPAVMLALASALLLGGCASMGAGGPGTRAVERMAAEGASAPAVGAPAVRVVTLDAGIANAVIAAQATASFAQKLGQGLPVGTVVRAGDVLDVAIWEAPPAALFGAAGAGEVLSARQGPQLGRGSSLPEQMVDQDGRIALPFVGKLAVAGRTARQIEAEIEARLAGKAHQPQAVVRLVRNQATSVTVMGDLNTSTKVQLTPKGERLLDVLAAAGGSRQPVGKTTVQITRGSQVVAMPLEAVIRDPAQNILLQPDDVVTAYYQPFSFTALGAVTNNAEIPFEATGLTLAQALGRVGGLRDERADARGVFIFRLEDPAALGLPPGAGPGTTPDGRIPVIYRIDLKDPASFFVAQGFPVRNRDVLYVSNAPAADLQKFLNIVSSLAFPIIGVANAL